MLVIYSIKRLYKKDFYEHLKEETLDVLCTKHYVKDNRRRLPIETLQGKYNWSFFYGICLAVKKKAFFRAGQFDDSLYGWGMEDIDFTFRLKKYGQLEFVPQAQLFHIPHIRNRYKNYEQNAYNYIYCLKKYNGFIEWELNYRFSNLAEIMSIMECITHIHKKTRQELPLELEENSIYINALSEEFPNGNITILKNGKKYIWRYVGVGIPVKNKQFAKCYLSTFLFNYPAPILSVLLQEACRIATDVFISKKKLVPSIVWGSDIEQRCKLHSHIFVKSSIKISDFKYVPVVNITFLLVIFVLSSRIIPNTSLFSTIKSSTIASSKVRFSWFCRTFNISFGYVTLSTCALNERTAGPLDEFNIFICNAVLSATRPIVPPNASISRTIIPLADPPIEGLHGRDATLFILDVINRIFFPIFAAAKAASHPA